jgi:hypothetical protein
MAPTYDILAATVTGMMVGNEFAIAAFVHPSLLSLGDLTHARIAARLARILGGAMPYWYGLALLLILGAAYEHRPIADGPGRLIAIAAALWTATIVFTIALLVPINNRIATLNPEQPYPTWLQDRARWDRLHGIRVALLILALLLLLAGLFGGITTPVS